MPEPLFDPSRSLVSSWIMGPLALAAIRLAFGLFALAGFFAALGVAAIRAPIYAKGCVPTMPLLHNPSGLIGFSIT